jgi:hypothetical protein
MIAARMTALQSSELVQGWLGASERVCIDSRHWIEAAAVAKRDCAAAGVGHVGVHHRSHFVVHHVQRVE